MRPDYDFLDMTVKQNESASSVDDKKLEKVGVKVGASKLKSDAMQGKKHANYIRKFNSVPWTEALFFDNKTEVSKNLIRRILKNVKNGNLQMEMIPALEYISKIVHYDIKSE